LFGNLLSSFLGALYDYESLFGEDDEFYEEKKMYKIKDAFGEKYSYIKIYEKLGNDTPSD